MDKYMQIAIDEARKGIKHGHGGPFGSCIVLNGKVVGKGHNRVVANNDCTCHGEINAIRNACKKLKTYKLNGATLYTTGMPCPMCIGAILWANISNVYYGCTIQDNARIGFRDAAFADKLETDYSHLGIGFDQLDRDECLKVFDEYKKIKNKKKY